MAGRVRTIIKKISKKILHSCGFDLIRYNVHTSEDVLLKTIVDYFQISTIFDVGANEGQYAEAILEQGFKGEVYSFEPILKVFKKLESKAQKKAKWFVENIGMGSQEEELNINVSENLTSSSILKINEATTQILPNTKVTHNEIIKLTTFDAYLGTKSKISREILLKLDVQGFELEALKGAVENLPQIKIIQAELSFVPIYEGAPLYQEVIKFLEKHGFEIFTIIPGFRDGKNGRMLQADGIFLNKRLTS